MNKPDCYTDEHKEYLDNLRESGQINMMGAGIFLRAEFPDLTRQQVQDVLLYWMKECK